MLVGIKNKLVTSVPLFNRFYKKYRIWKKRQAYKGLSNEDIFTNIYTSNQWDVNKVNDSGFYSGPGSYGEPAEKYVAFVSDFIQKNNITSLTDVGCGDFAIGSQLVEKNPLLQYNGCEVVKQLVVQNQQKAGSDHVKFYQLDASKNDLPKAELITIREVLQHLSNADIKNILAKTKAFKYAIITEHLLPGGRETSFNKDKPSGPDIRMVEGSGVYIDKPPFNLEASEVLKCRADGYKQEAYIKTFLIDNTKINE